MIYVVDDDKNTRKVLQIALKDEGFDVKVFHNSATVVSEIKNKEPDILILDMQIDELSGIDIFNKLQQDGFSFPVIFISGNSTLAQAVKGIQLGAFDFIEKPFAPEKLIQTIQNCLSFVKIKSENSFLKQQVYQDGFIGESKVFKELNYNINKVAKTQSVVIIYGESGTGKELVAKEIHRLSNQSQGPFIKVNCAAIPDNLIESEFFGYLKGAFTGADRNKKGYFELANNGTLFLDEVGEMSLSAQAKVLRAIQSQEIQKVGSEVATKISFRLVCATNKDLVKAVKGGSFREDLFYRLNVFPVTTPALRDRKSDIPILSYYFLKEYIRVNQLPEKYLSEQALERLTNYEWPGNIRELKNVIERIAILGGQILNTELLSFLPKIEPDSHSYENLTLKEYRNKMEREYLVRILKKHDGNISMAAQSLEIERTYLHKKIQDYQIHKKEFF